MWAVNVRTETVMPDDADRKEKPKFDLEERTARFGEAIIRFAKKIPRSPVNDRVIDQLVGAGTSIGANYCEADDAVSKKDFRNHIGTCRKESKETKFWLRMVATAEERLKEEARTHWQEAKELHLIFCSILRK
jgi:four helix bundle protein